MRISRDTTIKRIPKGYPQKWFYDTPYPAYPVRLKKDMPNTIVRSLFQAFFRLVNLYRVIHMIRFMLLYRHLIPDINTGYRQLQLRNSYYSLCFIISGNGGMRNFFHLSYEGTKSHAMSGNDHFFKSEISVNHLLHAVLQQFFGLPLLGCPWRIYPKISIIIVPQLCKLLQGIIFKG